MSLNNNSGHPVSHSKPSRDGGSSYQALVSWAYRMRKLPTPFNDGLPLLSSCVLFFVLTRMGRAPQLWNDSIAGVIGGLQLPENKDTMKLCIFGLNFGMFWLWTAVLSSIDHCGWMDPFRIQPKETPMPVQGQLMRFAPLVLFNQLVVAPIMIWLSVETYVHLSGGLGVEGMLWPTQFRFMRDVFLCALSADAWFYWTHLAFHKIPFLYKHIHKIHHATTVPVAVESVYSHPIEYALGGIGIYLIGAVVFRCHILAWFTWITVGTMMQVHDHCGFWLPFLPRALFHDYHHSSNNSCFGGPNMLWDTLFGTGGNYPKWEEQCLQKQGPLDHYGGVSANH